MVVEFKDFYVAVRWFCLSLLYLSMRTKKYSVEQLRGVFDIVADCRDMGRDVAAWNRVLVDGLHEAMQASHTRCGIIPNKMEESHFIDGSLWTERWQVPEEGQRWQSILANGSGPTLSTVSKFVREFEDSGTVRRCDLISNAIWQRSDEFVKLRRPCGQGDVMLSGYAIPVNSCLHVVSISLPLGNGRFTTQQREFLRLLHQELLLLMGNRLHLDQPAQMKDLPPRLKQVFALLLVGKSEREIASALGLSPHTVHDYVQDIYRRYQVRSRSELLAMAYQSGWK